MTFEEKMSALGALCSMPTDVTLFMRAPGDWGCSIKGVDRREGACLSGGGLSGKTPEAAVESAWRWATEGDSSDKYLLINGYGPNRRAVRWNGFMWADVEEKSRART